MWFRQDLRLADNPALLAAIADGEPVVPLVVMPEATWARINPRQRAYLAASWRALDAAVDGHLQVHLGDPVRIVPAVAGAVGAQAVHVSRDFSTGGERRDAAVTAALGQVRGGVPLVRTGGPYAVAPGAVRKGDGTPYRVFTPFYRAWLAHGWHAPAPAPTAVTWAQTAASESLPVIETDIVLPPAGEQAALDRWARFVEHDAAAYGRTRDRPDLDATSRMSIPLHAGEVHPRTLLASFTGHLDIEHPWVRQLAWRDFYADVTFHNPASRTHSLDARFDDASLWHDDDDAFAAWTAGRTGYPFVDAGMRQLITEGWMHNRVRMAVASFLVKDLHLPWQRGATHFMETLLDADAANNAHGWQWTAGSGTDASPFHRVFNPVLQGKKFDPDGDYVRRYIPALRHLPGGSAHEPWDAPDGYGHGYPARIVDHAAERQVALATLDRLKVQQR